MISVLSPHFCGGFCLLPLIRIVPAPESHHGVSLLRCARFFFGKSWHHLPEAYPLEAAIQFSRYTERIPSTGRQREGLFFNPLTNQLGKFFWFVRRNFENFFEIVSTNQLGNFFGFERKNFWEFFCEPLYYLIGNFSDNNKKNFEENF